MECRWYLPGEKKPLHCGRPAEVRSNLPLCDEHHEIQSHRRGATARQAAGFHPLESFPGWCYFVRLPNGLIKIGYSNTDDTLDNRLRSLGQEAGAPVVLLAKIPGGFVAEAVMHDRFRQNRLPGHGERFAYSPEMAEFLAGLSE